MKKIFTLLLAVAASVGTMFAEKVQIGDLYYNLDATNQTAEVTSQISSYPYWSTTITTAIIPASVEYNSVTHSVTSIGNSAFFGCSDLTSVTIPNSVTSIGEEAFAHCSGLTSIEIPNNVTSIGDYAFYNCTGLTSITIPHSVTSIGSCAFYECTGLTSVTIPNSVSSIGSCAFYECTGLTSVMIPNSVTSIGESAFQNCTGLSSVTIPNSVTSIGIVAFACCTGLTSIDVASDNSNYCSEDGVLFNKDKTTLIQYPGGKQGSYTIPNSVTSIGDGAFAYCTGLTSVTIPNSVTSIGLSVFVGCTGLTSVTIPNSVTSIGDGAFYKCTGLTAVTIPNSVTSIGESAFQNCTGLTSVTIEAEIPPTLGHYVFDGDENFPLTYPIYVPCNAVNAYKTAWSDYADRIVANCPSFTISFVNWDGSNLQTLSVTEGEMPQYTGSTPTRPDDEEYTYTFLGWTPAIVAVTEDATYTATYTATPKDQGIEEVPSDQVPRTKVLRNGMLFIERGEKVYTLQGQEAQ